VQTVLTTLVQAILAHRIGLPDLSTGFQRGVSAKAAESVAGSTEFRLVQVDGHGDGGLPVLRFLELRGDSDVSALVSASGIARIAPAATSIDVGEELIWFPFADCAT
jgi:molybdopterin biosynthesis enzyme